MQEKIHGKVNFPALVTMITRPPTQYTQTRTPRVSQRMVKTQHGRCVAHKIANAYGLRSRRNQLDRRNLGAGREIEDEDTGATAGHVNPCDQAAGGDVG